MTRRQPTTGTRECRECDAPAYSHHEPWCSRTDGDRGFRPRRRSHPVTGGWVAPLQGAQFAGSPQADTGVDPGDGGGNSGGDGGSL